jgi:hypothetical protein
MARPRLSKAEKIRSMLKSGRGVKAIVRAVGASHTYVYKLKRQRAA